MNFEEFKYIISTLKESESKRKKVGDFLEDELCEGSFCFFSFGSKLEDTIINMLADHFKCWWTKNGELDKDSNWYNSKTYKENDISWWIYEDNKTVSYTENGEKIEKDLTDIKDFYEFLTRIK